MTQFEAQYSIRGKGIPILVIGSKLFYERSFPESFNSYAKWIFLDHRGFAKRTSSKSELKSDYNLDKICKDIEIFRNNHKLGKVIILGHSAHGYMAMVYAAMFPKAILGVIVLNTGPNHGDSMHLASDQWDSLVSSTRKEKFNKDIKIFIEKTSKLETQDFISFCLSQSAKAWKDFTYNANYLWKHVHVNKLGIDYLYGEVFRDIKIEAFLSKIKSPIFLGMGLLDFQVAPYYSWEHYRKYFHRLRFRVFENSSHYSYMEESEEFTKELQSWLEEEIQSLDL